MREPANESLFTDVSRLRSYRCTIIVPTTSRAFVEREGCCASELDKGHKRVGKGVPLHAVPTRLPSFSESTCRLTHAPAPVQRQHPTRDIAMEAAMWPIANLRHMPMLHGI